MLDYTVFPYSCKQTWPVEVSRSAKIEQVTIGLEFRRNTHLRMEISAVRWNRCGIWPLDNVLPLPLQQSVMVIRPHREEKDSFNESTPHPERETSQGLISHNHIVLLNNLNSVVVAGTWPLMWLMYLYIYIISFLQVWTRLLDYMVRMTWQQNTYDILHLYSRRANCDENRRERDEKSEENRRQQRMYVTSRDIFYQQQ